jgi:predicted nucleic-acid-binding Zn-ribbon protein
MSPRSDTCPKCRGRMQAGYVPDFGTAVVQGSWFEGVPEKGLLGNLKLRGKDKYPITVHRCSSCGYLESYAAPESTIPNS